MLVVPGAATSSTSASLSRLRSRKKHANSHKSHRRSPTHPQQPTHDHHHQSQLPLPSLTSDNDEFPSIADVSELANLSHLVYRFKKLTNDSSVCEIINHKQYVNSTELTLAPKDLPLESDIFCHWYRHDLDQGTQVMIVSSKVKDYVAVVFAGTDDLKSALMDLDVFMEEFGTGNGNNQQQKVDKTSTTKIPIFIPLKDCPSCKVHAGFNRQVFLNGIFDDIYVRVESLREKFGRFFTTGHSLGAAASILTALAFALQDHRHREETSVVQEQPLLLPTVTSLNFGCPMIGNADFEDYVTRTFLTHSNNTRTNKYLRIWRLVLGWDLVPRLPSSEFFYHVGHTVQMFHPECKDAMPWCNGNHHNQNVTTHHHHWWNIKGDDDKVDPDDDSDNVTKSALAYYHHFGNATLHYDGVPSGWSAKPYLWVPGALMSHAIGRYATFLNSWNDKSPGTWVHDFVRTPSPRDDDDKYDEPPDDDAAALQESSPWVEATK